MIFLFFSEFIIMHFDQSQPMMGKENLNLVNMESRQLLLRDSAV